jgi:uncharacterized protein (TIGR02145 family)
MKFSIAKLFTVTLLLLALLSCKPTVKDVDGNKYKTVTIGTQVWMAENLKTTRYNDGTPIPLVTDYEEWAALTTPAYCWYNNDSSHKEVYGALYNWYAVNTAKICPEGWHVPSDEEWIELRNYLGSFRFVGSDLKETGTSHWKSPNADATNKSGFTALPGGLRSFNGSFSYIGIAGYWWTATEYTSTNVHFWNLRYKNSDLFTYIADKPNGLCIRCIQD